MKFVAAREKTPLPADAAVRATVGIGAIASGFGIEVDLEISIPSVERAKVEALVERAHAVCPYSNATRNNIDVRLRVA